MKLLRLLLVPFALLCVLAIRLAWPRWKVRFGTLWMGRIGHLAGNTEIYMCERDAGQHAGFTDFWIGDGAPANDQLYTMLKRVLPIGGTFCRTVALCNRLFAGFKRHLIPAGDLDRDPQNLVEKHLPHLYFTPEEIERGKQGLARFGLPAGAKWVCLIVRDGAYLPGMPYHAFRDADIDTYAEACAALVARGYYVFRMGVKVAKPITWASDRIIDLAGAPDYNFMSLYLGAKCEFCISTGCGFDAIPYIFRRPICFTNYVPLEYLFTFAQGSLAIWKHHEKNGKRMTPAEIYESKAGHFMRADEFTDAGIKLIDNTPEEIRAVVEEMIDGTHGDPQYFWRAFPRSVSEHTQRPLHGEIRMRIGAEFLRGYA